LTEEDLVLDQRFSFISVCSERAVLAAVHCAVIRFSAPDSYPYD